MNDNWSINTLPILKEENYNIAWSETWSSINEIGHMYRDHMFTYKEYKKTEQSFINFFIELFKYVHAHKVKIIQLKKNRFPVNATYDRKGVLRTWYDRIVNNMSVNLDDLQYIVPLILRENIWGTLYHKKSKTYIHFGYDYFVYVNSPLFHYRKGVEGYLNVDFEKLVFGNGLYIDYEAIRVTQKLTGHDYAEFLEREHETIEGYYCIKNDNNV